MSANHRPGTQIKTAGASWTDAAVDLRRQKSKESAARTKVLELQAAREEGQLVDAGEVRAYFGRVVGALRTQLMELGPSLAPRVNPADPVMAAQVIGDAIHRILASASEQVLAFKSDAVPGHRSMDEPP